jgi:diamine N-acetyltransferase
VAGFSKINLNATHSNIAGENATKLDRIYLLKEYQGLKLGFELLKFNIDFSKNNNQSGIWLFTWTGNTKAIDFYHKIGFEIIGSHDFYVAQTHYNPNYQMYLNFF